MIFIQIILSYIQNLFYKYRRYTWACYIILLLALLPFASKVKFLVEVEDFIGQDFASYTARTSPITSFIARKNLYLALTPPKSHKMTNKDLCLIKQWWVKTIEKSTQLESSFASFESRKIIYKNNQLHSHHYLNYDCSKEKENTVVSFDDLQKSPWSGVITGVKKNSQDVLISFSFLPYEKRGIFGYFNVNAVQQTMLSINNFDLVKNNKFKALWGGSGYYFYYLVKGYVYLTSLNFISIFILSLFMSYLFQSSKVGILFCTLYSLVFLPIAGLMGVLDFHLDPLLSTLPIMILLACVEDFIFILSKYDPSKKIYNLNHFLLPGFFTSLTTAIGFGSLIMADLAVIRRFGFLTGVAAFLEFIVMFYFFPILLSHSFFKDIKPRLRFNFTNLKRMIIPNKKTAILFLILPLFSSFFIYRLNFIDFPEKLFSKQHHVRSSAQVFLQKFGWSASVDLIYKKENASFITTKVLPNLKEDPVVAEIEDFYEIKNRMTKDSSQYEQNLVESLLESTDYSQKLIANSGPLMKSIVYVKSTQNNHLSKLWKKVDRLCNSLCELKGDLISYTEFSDKVVKGFHKSVFTSFILVLLIILFLAICMNEPAKWRLVLSAMWGPFVLLGIFTYFQLSIYFVTSIVVSIIIGLTGDNAIFFLLSNDQKTAYEGSKNLGRVSLTVSLTSIFVISLLFLSYFHALRELAALMILGFVLSILGDLFLFRSLFHSSPK